MCVGRREKGKRKKKGGGRQGVKILERKKHVPAITVLPPSRSGSGERALAGTKNQSYFSK